MTEKQFTFEFDGGAWGVPVFYNNNKKLSFDEVVDCLNNLHEENQALKKELNAFKPVIFQDTEKGDTIILYSKNNGEW